MGIETCYNGSIMSSKLFNVEGVLVDKACRRVISNPYLRPHSLAWYNRNPEEKISLVIWNSRQWWKKFLHEKGGIDE
jgi:hypothetical protein